MVRKQIVKGFNSFITAIQHFERTEPKIVVLFCGAKDSNGQSWCPDCRRIIPIIEGTLPVVNNDALFLDVEIEHNGWNDPNNPFRTDHRIRLTEVPTLLCWKSGHRYAGEDCKIPTNIKGIFQI